MSDQDTRINEHESISKFLEATNDNETTTQPTTQTEKLDGQNEMKTITIKEKTNYWLSDKAKAKKREYHKRYYQILKERKQQQLDLIEELKSKQITGCSITLMNVNGKTSTRSIRNEEEYLNLINDLISSLVDNGLLADYSIDAL